MLQLKRFSFVVLDFGDQRLLVLSVLLGTRYYDECVCKYCTFTRLYDLI